MNRVNSTKPSPNSASKTPMLHRLPLWITALILALIPIADGGFTTPQDTGFTAPDTWQMWLQMPAIAGVCVPIAIAMLLLAWREWRTPRELGAAPYIASSAALVLLWALISIVHSPALYLSLNALCGLTSAMAAAAIIARACGDRDQLVTVASAIVLAGAIEGILGVREYLVMFHNGVNYYRIFGTFINPDFLAGYLILVVPISMALIVGVKERIAKLLCGLALVFQISAIMLSGSRAGIGVLVVEIILWTALCTLVGTVKPFKKQFAIVWVLALAAAIPSAMPLRARAVKQAPVKIQHVARSLPSQPTGPVTASKSLLFREYTWKGTLKLAEHNPVLGAGLGTFNQTYPRYAITAYTAHAHNSLLQWAAETGLPGAVFLSLLMAAVAAFCANVLRLWRSALLSPDPEERADFHPLCVEPSLLLTALVAALVGSTLKTFIDSDWYITATLFTLASIAGLAVGIAREMAPLATLEPTKLPRWMPAAAAVSALFLLIRGYQVGSAQWSRTQGAALYAQQDPNAAQLYLAAAHADPLNPNNWLEAAEMDQVTNNLIAERRHLLRAVAAAPIGKTFYRLGQFYEAQNETKQADKAFTKALGCDPHNLQTLHQLANVLLQEGNTNAAADMFTRMCRLEHEPYGTVRAIADQVVEVEYAYAHAGLGDIYSTQGHWNKATIEYGHAAATLELFWKWRNQPSEMVLMTPNRRDSAYKLYLHVLTAWQVALTHTGAPAAEVASLASTETQVTTQHAQDAQKTAGANGQ